MGRHPPLSVKLMGWGLAVVPAIAIGVSADFAAVTYLHPPGAEHFKDVFEAAVQGYTQANGVIDLPDGVPLGGSGGEIWTNGGEALVTNADGLAQKMAEQGVQEWNIRRGIADAVAMFATFVPFTRHLVVRDKDYRDLMSP